VIQMPSRSLIDLDIHHTRRGDAELLDYLDDGWRDYAYSLGFDSNGLLAPAGLNNLPPNGNNKRLDAFPSSGGPPASDYTLLCEQALDPYGTDVALLGHEIGHEAAHSNPEFAHALATALNNWSLDVWLDGMHDRRLYGALVVATHDPDQGAAEIRRAGQHEKFASALIPYAALGKPLGHPVYHPIYEACAEMALPVHIHTGGGEFLGGAAPYITGGTAPHYRFEVYSGVSAHSAQNHLVSMIAHGVFEKYPSLMVIAAETGQSWLPWFAASLDANYEILRRESGSVRMLPSRYLRERVVFTTQPCETSLQEREEFVAHLRLLEGIEEMLCYSSDYPHWDADPLPFLESVMPKEWHERIFYKNALKALRLPQSVITALASRVLA